MTSNFNQPEYSDLNLDHDIDYTQYTANSLIEDSFELDANAEHLLDYNQTLIDGFNCFIEKDSDGLIRSYQTALELLEDKKGLQNRENLISVKANLGIAYFYNSQINRGI